MIDLHCHTNISDCSMTIEEVISEAKAQGVTHLAITDHDTTKGLHEAEAIGNRLGVSVIPGIEISAYDYERDVRAHILGYYVTPGHEAIGALCNPLLKKRHEASYEMVKRMMAAGYVISWEQVTSYATGGTAVYKQHIMQALIENGYTDRVYGDLYKKLFHKGNSKETSGIAYVPLQYIDAFDAIQAIRDAGGVPVLAHPKQFNNFPAISDWAEKGLEGIEVKHPLHGPSDEKKATEFADAYKLIRTGGSDFHGRYGDNKCQLGSKSLGIDCIHALLERKQMLGVKNLV